MMHRAAHPLVILVVILAAWEAASRLLRIPSYLLPPPSAVATDLVDRFPYLLGHAAVTASEVGLGFGLSVVIGIPLAIAIVASPAFGRSVYPILVTSQTIPKIAIAPIFVVWFGFGLLPKVLIAFIIGFFPVVIAAVVGLQATDPEMLQLVRSMGGSKWQAMRKVRFPNALPSIFGGLKVAATLSVVGAVVGEFVGSNSGLGYVLLVATGQIRTTLLFAAIVFLMVMGLILFYVMDVAERKITPWHRRSGIDDLTTTTL